MEKSRRWKQNRHRIQREKDRLRKRVRQNVYALSKVKEASVLRKLLRIIRLGK
jgi:F0F1-type ATP synthase membrane subunit b/b'